MPDFSLEAMNVLQIARGETQFFQKTCLGSEYFLSGLLRDRQGQATQVLQHLGVDLLQTSSVISRLSAPGEPLFTEAPVACLTSEVRHVWHRARDEAQHMQQQVESIHLLLALLLQSESNAYQVLQHLDLQLEELHSQIFHALSSASSGAARPIEAKPQKSGFNKFTQRARLILVRSEAEALLFQHPYIDLEHLFLGLLCAGNGVAFQALTMLGVDLNRLEQAFMRQLCSTRNAHANLFLTPRAKRVIELAVEEAFRFGHHYLGTEHLLLGMLRIGEGRQENLLMRLGLRQKGDVAEENLFANVGLNVKMVREWVLFVLAGGASDDSISVSSPGT